MRKVKRYISRNWIWIIVGLVLTGVFVKLAYAERGYVAYGGEWLILPLVIAIVEIVRTVKNAVRYSFGTEDDL